MPNFRILPRRGKQANAGKANLLKGEIAYCEDTQELIIGDGAGSFVKVAEVVIGPHDQNLYTKFAEESHYYPLGINVPQL